MLQLDVQRLCVLQIGRVRILATNDLNVATIWRLHGNDLPEHSHQIKFVHFGASSLPETEIEVLSRPVLGTYVVPMSSVLAKRQRYLLSSLWLARDREENACTNQWHFPSIIAAGGTAALTN